MTTTSSVMMTSPLNQQQPHHNPQTAEIRDATRRARSPGLIGLQKQRFFLFLSMVKCSQNHRTRDVLGVRNIYMRCSQASKSSMSSCCYLCFCVHSAQLSFPGLSFF